MDDDFERRRELRRQKREEMRMEAERLMYQRNEDDEEEAARERRRRARQERMKNLEEPVTMATEGEALDSNSVAERDAAGGKGEAVGHNDEEGDHALLERLAKREERRQRRALEAAERQWRELEAPAEPERSQPGEKEEEEPEEEVPRRSFLGEQETVLERPARSLTELSEKPVISDDDAERAISRAEVEEEEGGVSGNEAEGGTVAPLGEEHGEEMRLVEVEGTSEEELGEREMPGEGAEGGGSLSEQELTSPVYIKVCEEKLRRSFSRDEETPEEKPKWSLRKEEQKPPGDPEPVLPQMENSPQSKQPNGGLNEDFTARHRKPERTLSRGSTHSAEEEQEDVARQEAERKLEELKRRRGETETEEFQRMRQRQQEAEAELEDLRRRREERRKVLEEEELTRRQEQEEKKAKEEEEKRRMKQEIERRRAEAAEKRHRVEDTADGESRRPFQCLGPKTGSMKIGERAEFLNKSAQRSSVKMSHSPVVSKIDNRLEQYTTAVQTNKEVKAPKSAAIDLPVVTDGVRNIKSMWERGNVFSSAGTPGSTNKETASMKIGVAGRINDWLNKVPESSKSGGGKPVDLRPGDVTNKRNLWENKGSAPDKVTVGGKNKSASNGH